MPISKVARRDLVVRVVSGYFGLIAAEGRLNAAQRGAEEATAFRDLTMKLESGREVAHADVVKADLEVEQRQREFSDAQLAEEKARLDLGVLLFPDPRTNYQVAASEPPALPAEDEVEAAAGKENPDLRSALETVRAAHAEVEAARAAYYPSLSLNYTYGVDAPQLAVEWTGPCAQSRLLRLCFTRYSCMGLAGDARSRQAKRVEATCCAGWL